MPTEENEQNQPRDHSLDELAKGLASGSLSRHDALKLAGAAIVGGLLSAIPGVAWADHKPGHGTPPGQGGTPPGQGAEVCTTVEDPCFTPCGPKVRGDRLCACVPTTEGAPACVEFICGEPCTTGADCPSGLCGAAGCCNDQPVCLTPCGTAPTLAAREGSAVWGSR